MARNAAAPRQEAAGSLPRLPVHCEASYERRHSHHARRVASSRDEDAAPLDIEIDGCVVTLLHPGSNVVERRLRFPDRVMDAVMAKFRPREDGGHTRIEPSLPLQQQSSLCVLMRTDCIRVYAPRGDVFDVALPFHADRMIAQPLLVGGGLLLQRRPPLPSVPTAAATAAAFSPSATMRQSPLGTTASPSSASTPAFARSVHANPPRYFTLAHPLEEVKPVALETAQTIATTHPRRSSLTPTSATTPTPPPPPPTQAYSFLSDRGLQLVDLCTFIDRSHMERALVICFHLQDRRFFVFESLPFAAPPSTTSSSSSHPSQRRSSFPNATGTPTATASASPSLLPSPLPMHTATSSPMIPTSTLAGSKVPWMTPTTTPKPRSVQLAIPNAMPSPSPTGTYPSAASPIQSWLSPAKHRQQQRELAMEERYLRSHIVPDRRVRLVWTSPCVDALLPRRGKRSRESLQVASLSTLEVSSRGKRSVFVASAAEDAKQGLEGGSSALCMMDETLGLLLVTTSLSVSDQDASLRVIRCRRAIPIALQPLCDHWCSRVGSSSSSSASLQAGPSSTDVVLWLDDGRLELYSAGRIVAQLNVPKQEESNEAPVSLVSVDAAGVSDDDAFELTMLLADKRIVWRCPHPLNPPALSSLVALAFNVLAYVLSHRDATCIRTQTISRAAKMAATIVGDDSGPCKSIQDSEEDLLWSAFQSVLMTAKDSEADADSSSGVENDDERVAGTTANLATDDPYEDMMRSTFARTYRHGNPMVCAMLSRSDCTNDDSVSTFHTETEKRRVTRSRVSDDELLSLEVVVRSLQALHLLYEELRLSLRHHCLMLQLGAFLVELATHLGATRMASYHRSQSLVHPPPFGKQATVTTTATSTTRAASRSAMTAMADDESDIPDVYDWLRRRMQPTTKPPMEMFPSLGSRRAKASPSSVAISPLWRTTAVIRVFNWIFASESEHGRGNRSYLSPHTHGTPPESGMTDSKVPLATRLAVLMDFLASDPIGMRITIPDLPFGVRLPILDAIRVFREDPPPYISDAVCRFIGRVDLAGRDTSNGPGHDDSSPLGLMSQSQPTHSTASVSTAATDSDERASRREVCDGLTDIVKQSQPLFPSDQRMKEVARLVRSSRPLCLRLDKTSDMTDHDFLLQQQDRLLLLCKRALALPVARGMVTLGMLNVGSQAQQHRSHAWRLEIPALPLAGRTPPTNALVALDVPGNATELTHWPHFHNGCAAGLKLQAQDLSGVVNRYWIKYHRPSANEFGAANNARSNTNQVDAQSVSALQSPRTLEEAQAAHAGMLLGLGLRGHLKCLSMADVYNYLSMSNEFITVAVLLGMATTVAHGRRQQHRQLHQEQSHDGQQPRRSPPNDEQIQVQAWEMNNSATDSISQDMDLDISMDATTAPATASASSPEVLSTSPTPSPGLAAGMGLELSLERSVSKMLCLHIPSLLPAPFAEFSVPAATQTAALLGLGILYQGSGHRLMTELLLTEIIRSPSSAQFGDGGVGHSNGTQHGGASASASSSSSNANAPFNELEGYSLAAGLALGLVMLGRGRATSGDPGLDDLGLEEKLYKYIVGGAQHDPHAHHGANGTGASNGTGMSDAMGSGSGNCLYRGRPWTAFGTGSGSRIGAGIGGRSANGQTSGVGMGIGTKPPLDRNAGARLSGVSGGGGGGGGDHVNIGVTASGSALALAFMYMKTGNRTIAAQLAVPDTLILLEYVRPDLLLIRTLAKNLVLWQEEEEIPTSLFPSMTESMDIDPSISWIENVQVPSQLHNAYHAVKKQQGNEEMHTEYSALNTLPQGADVRSICEAYANVVTGACLSMGLRFAGTGNTSARETIRRYVLHFRDLRGRAVLFLGARDLVATATERVTIERCLGVCAQALALVDAGSGHLETFTLLRSLNLRQRVDSELTFGNHMALSMAIGLLFLGGGRATLSRSREAIAALVIALFPVNAMNAADNKHHLQAFRHLYVLAVDTDRLVETVDTRTKASCRVQIRVQREQRRGRHQQRHHHVHVSGPHTDGDKGEDEWMTLTTPCLLPELSTIRRIAVDDPEYFPVDIVLPGAERWSTGTIKGSPTTKATANDARIRLLMESNTILLHRRRHAHGVIGADAGVAHSFEGFAGDMNDPHVRVLPTPGGGGSALVAASEPDRIRHLCRIYLQDGTTARTSAKAKETAVWRSNKNVRSRYTQVSVGGQAAAAAATWWRQLHDELAAMLCARQDDDAHMFSLQAYLDALYAVFHLGHPRLRFDDVTMLWNLTLLDEYHRVTPFREEDDPPSARELREDVDVQRRATQARRNALDVCDHAGQELLISARNHLTMEGATYRDFVQWLRDQTEESLRQRWRFESVTPMASLSAVRDTLLAHQGGNSYEQAPASSLAIRPSASSRGDEQMRASDSFLLAAIFHYLAAPSSVSREPVAWRQRMRALLDYASATEHGRFALDRFLLCERGHRDDDAAQDGGASADEQTFWLRLVSFFLFTV